MNERIRELRREAEKWVADNFSTDELDPYEWWEKEEQKFAELIVCDCIDYCGENLSKTVGAALKIHFGVEE